MLDREVPREGARVHLEQYGGGPDEGRIIANKTGYLRLGVECLKAAYAPTGKDSTAVELDLDYLLTTDSSIGFDWFERREPGAAAPARSGRLAAVAGVALVTIVGLLILVGLIVVVRWLSGWF